jgi:hypothetical protein
VSHSYSSNRIHLIFSTKNREKRISRDLQTKLWPYMAGIARNHGFEAIKVVHSTLRVTPAMESGLSNHVWNIEELCGLLPRPVSSAREAEKNLVLKAFAE